MILNLDSFGTSEFLFLGKGRVEQRCRLATFSTFAAPILLIAFMPPSFSLSFLPSVGLPVRVRPRVRRLSLRISWSRRVASQAGTGGRARAHVT